ncbi:MAG: adenylate cyclase regulatory domain-containing protein [Patulibacter sp.]
MSDEEDFEALGLLDGLNGPARHERMELLTWLRRERQLPDAMLLRSTRNGTILLTAAGVSLGAGPRYNEWEIAESTGLPIDFLHTLSRASALPLPADPEETVFGEAYMDVAHSVSELLAAGLSETQLLGIARVLSLGLAQAAELMRKTVMEIAIAPGVSELELARTYAAASEGLLPLVGPILEDLLRLHLYNAVRDEIVTHSERQEGSLPGAREVAVAFADLVGFTRLGEQLPPDELEQVADQLVGFAGEVVEPPVRFVKSVGDAVLLVSPDPLALLDVAFDLLERVDDEGSGYPQLRVGLAFGPAVSRAGDWFGRPVNLASRLTGVARAGSVVVDDTFRSEVGDADGVLWSEIGDRRLKGISSPTRLFRARRPSAASTGRRR